MKNVRLIAISLFIAIAVFTVGIFIYHKADNNKLKDNLQKYNVKSEALHNKKAKENNGLKPAMEKTELKLSYEGTNLAVAAPIYIEKNKYYLPLEELIIKINGTLFTKNEKNYIKYNNKLIELDTKNNVFKCDNNVHKFRHKLIPLDDIIYISLFDFTNMLNLKPSFEYDKNAIMLYNCKDNFSVSKKTNSNKTALLRLEDITAGKTYRYHDAESKYKLRIVADYLYSKNIPFHIAWIPRYIDKEMGNNIDNNLVNKCNMNNADFMYTLDYFINKGGIIGLHGYTHQSAKEKSVDSFEFASPKDKSSYTADFALKRINMAKETAEELNIPINFFEAPHYSVAPNQLKTLENNFDYIYEPYITSVANESKDIITKSCGKRVIKYIPTPLNYLDGKNDLPNMFNKINNLKGEVMASFFFHPNIEFADIKIVKDEKGYSIYTYSKQSALHQIVDMLERKGYSFKAINKL